MNADHEPVIITRDRGKPAAVLMSLEDYASFEETRYLLASPKNAARLRDAFAELDKRQGPIFLRRLVFMQLFGKEIRLAFANWTLTKGRS